jgi:hypothetical protein
MLSLDVYMSSVSRWSGYFPGTTAGVSAVNWGRTLLPSSLLLQHWRHSRMLSWQALMMRPRLVPPGISSNHSIHFAAAVSEHLLPPAAGQLAATGISLALA